MQNVKPAHPVNLITIGSEIKGERGRGLPRKPKDGEKAHQSSTEKIHVQDSNLAQLALSQEEMHMNSTNKGSKTDLQTGLKVINSESHETLNENNKAADEMSNELL